MTREEFVLNGIQDTVGTIRAFDLKAQIFLAILFIPFTTCEFWYQKASTYCLASCSSEIEAIPTIWWFLLLALLVLTFVCIFFLIQTLFLSQDPKESIEDAPSGVFYSSNLLNKNPVTFSEIQAEYPQDDVIIKELIYEHFKLKRIRQKKETTFLLFMKSFKIWFGAVVCFAFLTFLV